MSEQAWYALRLKSNREFAVRAALEGVSIETFLPTWSEEVRWSDRMKRTERVLFPGYIFVRLGDGPDFYRAVATRGVVQLLPNSYNPAPISAREIEDVQRVVKSRLTAAPCEYAAGEAVLIDSGPLAGIRGVVVRTRGSMAVVVSVEMLRRSIRVELDAGTLIREKSNA
jgi:transcription antitermination factor NusG